VTELEPERVADVEGDPLGELVRDAREVPDARINAIGAVLGVPPGGAADPEPGGGGGSAGGGSAGSVAGGASSLKLVVAVGTLCIALGGVVAVWIAVRGDDAKRASTPSAAPSVPAAPDARAVEAEPEPEASEVRAVEPRSHTEPRSRPATRTAPRRVPPAPSAETAEAIVEEGPSSGPSSLAIEAQLLGRAQAALGAEPRTALSIVEQHAREFPAGVMAQERDALRIEALVALGEQSRARTAAARFHRDYPRSGLRDRVRAVVAR
jgi:hypothetical protein